MGGARRRNEEVVANQCRFIAGFKKAPSPKFLTKNDQNDPPAGLGYVPKYLNTC